MNMRWVMALIGLAALIDQLTKAAALSLLSRGEVVPVLPGFNLTLPLQAAQTCVNFLARGCSYSRYRA